MFDNEKPEQENGPRVQREVLVELTDAEMLVKGEAAAEVNKKIIDIELEFERIKDRYKSDLKLLRLNLSQFLYQMKERKEIRNVDCETKKDFKRRVVTYWYRDQKVHERVMHPEDYQLTLVDGAGKEGDFLPPKEPK